MPRGGRSPWVVGGSAGRKVAVGADGKLYVAFLCAGTPYLAISTDGGQTFGTAVAIPGFSNLQELAIQAGPARTLYSAAMDNQSNLLFAVSEDQGQTWSAVATLANNLFGFLGNPVPALATFGSSVYVSPVGGGSPPNQVQVFANPAGGVGAFSALSAQVNQFFGGLYTDSSGNVWVGGEIGNLHVAESLGGAPFGPATTLSDHGGCTAWRAARRRRQRAGQRRLLVAYTDGNGNVQATLQVFP